MRRILAMLRDLVRDERGSVFVEYILLLTIIGLAAVVGIACVRNAVITELVEVGQAISQIIIVP